MQTTTQKFPKKVRLTRNGKVVRVVCVENDHRHGLQLMVQEKYSTGEIENHWIQESEWKFLDQ